MRKIFFLYIFLLFGKNNLISQNVQQYQFKFREKSDSASIARLEIINESSFKYYTKIGKTTFSDSGTVQKNENSYILNSHQTKSKRKKFNNTKLNILKNHWLQIRVNDCVALDIPDMGGFFVPVREPLPKVDVAVWDSNFVKQTVERMEIVPFYLFPDPWYKQLVDMESYWVKNFFIETLFSFGIQLNCAECTRAYIDAVFYIGGDGKVLDYEIIDERVCGGIVKPGLAKKFVEYFLNQTYPEGVRGKGVLFVIGNGLKC